MGWLTTHHSSSRLKTGSRPFIEPGSIWKIARKLVSSATKSPLTVRETTNRWSSVRLSMECKSTRWVPMPFPQSQMLKLRRNLVHRTSLFLITSNLFRDSRKMHLVLSQVPLMLFRLIKTFTVLSWATTLTFSKMTRLQVVLILMNCQVVKLTRKWLKKN